MLRLKTLIKEKYLEIGDFTLSSGRKSEYYFDIKSLMLDPLGARLVGTAMRNLIPKHLQAQERLYLGGLELGAALLAPIMSLQGFQTFVIRKKAKEYGLGGRIIGDLNWNGHVILMDDVITSGKSIQECMDYLKGALINPIYIICIIDRSDDKKYLSLFKESDFFNK